MTALVLAIGFFVAGAASSLAAARSASRSAGLGLTGTIAGCIAGATGALPVALGGAASQREWAWPVPYGSLAIGIDGLSALFLLVILVVSAMSAAYGKEYLAHRTGGGSPVVMGFFFNLLVAAMVLVVIARNGILFLVAWELVAVTSFFLVTFDDAAEEVRRAGRTYLVAAHLGAAALVAMFALLGRGGGSLDFDRLHAAGLAAPPAAGLVFALGLIGFGMKAGFLPLHFWLPEAHPAAPSHVSALLSGAMLALGVYGIARLLTFLPEPATGWGTALIVIGVLTAAFGALLASIQRDLKRLLAYSSIEHMGVIAVGLGLGVIGEAKGDPGLAALGYGGALLHVANHALAKSLLFLGAGAVLHRTGSRSLDRLGGLLTPMPITGAAFLAGSASLVGVPPLGGFASELLIYLAALRCLIGPGVAAGPEAMAVLLGLGLTGGLAAIGAARAFGTAFLGHRRHGGREAVTEVGPWMRVPMILLAAGCVLAGPGALAFTHVVLPAAAVLMGSGPGEVLAPLAAPLRGAAIVASSVLALSVALIAVRRVLIARRTKERAGTWDCGYGAFSPRMQFTASSFSRSVERLFSFVVHAKETMVRPEGHFPRSASFATETPDVVRESLLGPAWESLTRGLSKARWIQHGHLNLYLLYITVTLLVLLIWKLR